MLHKAPIRPIVIYGVKCWPLSKKDGKMFRIFERRILRMIYSPNKNNCEWRTSYNKELYTFYDELTELKW